MNGPQIACGAQLSCGRKGRAKVSRWNFLGPSIAVSSESRYIRRDSEAKLSPRGLSASTFFLLLVT